MLARFLPPPEACKFLFDEYGIRRTKATLAKQRVIGGNTPPHRKVNRNIYYSIVDLREWAEAALSTRYRTTSDNLSPLVSTKHGERQPLPQAGSRGARGSLNSTRAQQRRGRNRQKGAEDASADSNSTGCVSE